VIDYPQTPGGYASGIDPDSIRVVIGDRIVPREHLQISEVTDPKEKQDPGSPAREFLLVFDPDDGRLSNRDNVYVLSRDLGKNLLVERLVRKHNGTYEWSPLSRQQGESLATQFFPDRSRPIPEEPKVCDVREFGVLWCRAGKMIYTSRLGSDLRECPRYEVTGFRLEELHHLGLESLDCVQVWVEGRLDGQKGTIEMNDYKIKRICPRRDDVRP
jgi:hypothetical protein